MENLILLLTASLVWIKSSRKFKRTFLGTRGSSVEFAPDVAFEHTCHGGDELYFSEHKEKFVTYGVLVAHLCEELDQEDARTVLTSYLNRLRKPFKAPYNTGITDCSAGTIAMVDYWQDEDSVDWKLKACSDGKTMAILYVKNINDAEVEKQDAFLNSFRFGKA
jgi:hypothetical protein